MTTAVKERPILFSSAMIQALLAGRKTQTRRVIPNPVIGDDGSHLRGWRDRYGSLNANLRCPHGSIGERIWVRETYRFPSVFDGKSAKAIGESCLDAGYRAAWCPTRYEVDGYTTCLKSELSDFGGSWGKIRQSIFCPRWASRILLEITDVRVERLRDISEADALAEGFDVDTCAPIFREAAGRTRQDFARWLELPDGSEPEGYWCLDCVGKAARKLKARVCGWNDCFETDSVPFCNDCERMLYHSLTKYGVDSELGFTEEEGWWQSSSPVAGSHAMALAEAAEGMGELEEEHHGRMAQMGLATCWDQINGPGSWALDPWVWAITFRRVEAS